MDWGALLMIERAVFSMEQAALGYIAFSITMVIGRLSGDYVMPRIERRAILLGEHWWVWFNCTVLSPA